jgi:hypothetical protein
MLSKLIVRFYETLIEIVLWLFLIIALIGGWTAGGFFAGIGALVSAFIFCVLFGGAFLVLADIQKRVKSIEEKLGS